MSLVTKRISLSVGRQSSPRSKSVTSVTLFLVGLVIVTLGSGAALAHAVAFRHIALGAVTVIGMTLGVCGYIDLVWQRGPVIFPITLWGLAVSVPVLLITAGAGLAVLVQRKSGRA